MGLFYAPFWKKHGKFAPYIMEKQGTSSRQVIELFKQKVQSLSSTRIESFRKNPNVDAILEYKNELMELEKEILKETRDASFHNQLELVIELQQIRLESISRFHKVLEETG